MTFAIDSILRVGLSVKCPWPHSNQYAPCSICTEFSNSRKRISHKILAH